MCTARTWMVLCSLRLMSSLSYTRRSASARLVCRLSSWACTGSKQCSNAASGWCDCRGHAVMLGMQPSCCRLHTIASPTPPHQLLACDAVNKAAATRTAEAACLGARMVRAAHCHTAWLAP